MYAKEFQQSLAAVEAARAANIAYEPKRMTAQEKDDLLAAYHPDYKKSEFSTLKIGPNKGEQVPHELCEMLQANSRITANEVDLSQVKYDVDVLIIGGGGAGASAAIEADNAGAKVLVVTKLRMGDANTMMAEGGIQAADKPNDSPAQLRIQVVEPCGEFFRKATGVDEHEGGVVFQHFVKHAAFDGRPYRTSGRNP